MSENGSESDQTTSNSSDNQSKNGDEQIQSMSVGEIDPAILYVRERVKIRYSKDQLLEIAQSPSSNAKPEFLDPNEVSVSILIPEKWNLERKKSDTPDTGSRASDAGDNRRRPGDPRERIRKENDGIVLSPQRRSFNSGCFVPANKEPIVGKGGAPPHIMAVRDIASSNRRIGSGRIIRDSWDDKESGESDFGNFGKGQSRNNERDRDRDDKFGDRGMRDDKFERRSFGRDMDGGKDKEGRRNTRYSESRRRFSDHKEDEPEWFSSGPISQNDTIELRGFDEPERPNGKKKAPGSRVKRAKDWSKKKESTIAEDKDTENEPKGRSTPSQSESGPAREEIEDEQNSGSSTREARREPNENSGQGENIFDFDEFLKGENIPGLLTNGVEEAKASTSRFSRWFKKDSPNREIVGSSRRSSMQDDNHIIKDLLKDINDSSSIPVTIHPPMDSNTYFAPISPAGNTPGGLENLIGDKARSGINMGQSVNIMEMLTRGKQQPNQQQLPDGWGMKPQGGQIGSSKILSLDELEAKIRPHSDHSANMQPKGPTQKPDEEMTAAFKRLLQQAGGHPGSQNGPKPPMSLLEMLSHSQQQDEARFAAAQAAASQQHQQHQLLTALHQHQGQQPHNDLTMKLQQAQMQQKQQQMDMLGKLMSGGAAAPHVRASPILDLGPQQSRELLSRPEAQAILQGLKRGEITIQHLYQQIANPALQPRHREMLVTIIKLHGNSTTYGPSPRVLSPVPIPSHHLYPPQQPTQIQQQQLRVSPLPPNAMHQRIPSPRELQVHTQNILQRALIKKKLEEQTENFRKKQEMQRGASPNPAAVSGVNTGNQQSGGKGVSSPTPLAFTPTSVLRKMTADKDEGKENKAVTDNGIKPQGRPLTGMRQQPQVAVNNQQWQFPMKHAGRPIVKANNFQSQTPDQFFAQLAAQQQPLAQQRTYQPVPTAAHRKPIIGQQQYSAQGSQYGPAQPQYPHPNPQSFTSQPTAQQLRAQHQHRPSNSTSAPVHPQVPSQSQPPIQGQGSQSGAAAQQKPQQPPMGYHQQGPQQQGTAAWQQFLNSAAQHQNTRPIGSRGTNQQSGALSPSTADQLTRWFSPDLLERARGGELPSTANLARLEEIERQAAPPVHN